MKTTILVEVRVLRVVRWPAARRQSLNRWHYCADIAERPQLSTEAIRIGVDGAYRVRVDRRLNPRWKPTVFHEGSNVYTVDAIAQDSNETNGGMR